MDWSIITSIITVLCGSSTIITFILYRKQQKRLITAEAFEKEVDALKSAVETMRQQLQFYDGRLTEMQKLVIGKDAYIEQLSKEKHVLEIKNAKNKSAINKAYECNHCTDISLCPVLMQRTINEEEYLKKISKS
ncbi:MAG: hypothetical protein LBH19_02955 [Dysgonamonadaceae bacterium]|jgi:hypothetical protein|nr:hypothetical protein [Dysgonamonadaceae bacterium]